MIWILKELVSKTFNDFYEQLTDEQVYTLINNYNEIEENLGFNNFNRLETMMEGSPDTVLLPHDAPAGWMPPLLSPGYEHVAVAANSEPIF